MTSVYNFSKQAHGRTTKWQREQIVPVCNQNFLCIDSLEAYDFSGRVINPYMDEFRAFSGAKQMIDLMEAFFEEIAFPQEYYTLRSFAAEKAMPERRTISEIVRYHEDAVLLENRGAVASILFQVQYRQNAAWQGRAEWVERGVSRPFRSILEFLHLVEAAATQGAEKAFGGSWED
jgi:hypothetical protein